MGAAHRGITPKKYKPCRGEILLGNRVLNRISMTPAPLKGKGVMISLSVTSCRVKKLRVQSGKRIVGTG